MEKYIANYRVIIEPDEELGTGKPGFTAYVPKLGIADSGYSVEETLKNVTEGIACFVESLLQDGESIPVPDRVEEDLVTTVSFVIPTRLRRQYQEAIRAQVL